MPGPLLAQRFAAEFYSELHAWAAAGSFIGKDQNMMNWMFARNPSSYAFLPGYAMKQPQCAGDEWFALWDWFAGSEARASYGCTQDRPPLAVYSQQGDFETEEQDHGFISFGDALARTDEHGALLSWHK